MKGGMWQENNSVSCHKYKMNVPFKSIKQQLHREAKEGIVWIEKETEQSISFIDDASFSKPVTMVDPDCIDEEWIQQHIWIQPGIRDVPVDNLVKTLNKIKDKQLLSCLRHLIVVQSCDDVEDYIRTHFFDYELDEFMDMYPFADDDAIGLFWFYANCPIVFAKNIRDAVRDLAQTTFLNENEEYQRGILTTALHEIYHLGASSRFFPQFEDTEDAAEQFCVFFPI